uniref:Uncharacterized protein n=1 Tax=Anguilla anguilla TaxID=7936 RepID=A0A0E9RUA4_ANGAN
MKRRTAKFQHLIFLNAIDSLLHRVKYYMKIQRKPF